MTSKTRGEADGAARRRPVELDDIVIRGAREHNLKSINVSIPKKRFVVLTGVSGSGKSSLAFDTLYAEGQRRYVESLSAYARQFLGQMEKPKYDTIRGLSPTIAIEQKTTGSNPRSTVGTITEISDYLRVLFARVGQQHCHQCGKRVQGQSAQRIASELFAGKDGTRLSLLAPMLVNRKGEHRELLADARAAGFVRLRVDGTVVESAELEALDKRKKHDVEAVVDRIVIGQASRERITDSVESALRVGKGTLIAVFGSGEERVYSQHLACTACGISFPDLSPQAFSFNGPQGMCQDCNGLGTRVAIDASRVIPDDSLTIDQGAIASWGPDVSQKTGWSHDFRGQLIKLLGLRFDEPISKLTKKQKSELLFGTGEKQYTVRWSGKSGQGSFKIKWEGLIPRLMRRFGQTKSERAKKWYAQFMADTACTACGGHRLRAESQAVRIGKHSIVHVSDLTVVKAREFFAALELSPTEREIATEVLKEIRARLEFLEAVGLGYLSLSRGGPTLSGGESQRIRLASQVGSELTGVTYVLDEPSIGLHQRDNQKLLDTLLQMRDIGNTVVAVEHDEDTIRSADHVIDFGPGAGTLGGNVVFQGSPEALLRCADSLTGAYLSGKKRITIPTTRRTPKAWLTVHGARQNNLKDIDVAFPLGVLTAVTGVSGAGKSSLVNGILYPALSVRFHGSTASVGAHTRIKGMGHLDKVVNIDQKPIGRTPRSNPVTYVKIFDEIRHFFAELPASKTQGFKAGRFSFNTKGGRCERCEGDGVRQIEMHFLADVYVRCEECAGRRFNDATLAVTYKGRSIADVLALTVREAAQLFENHPKIREPLNLLLEVGLEYLQLGQPSPTLSGGEAQRIKLARELSKRATGKTLYILDEPTTGLHFDDIDKLLRVLQRLVDTGNTVVVIEHNLDVIRASDHVIDIGPEGGPAGGKLIAAGTPEEICRVDASYTGQCLAKLVRERPEASGPRRSATKRATANGRARARAQLARAPNGVRQ